MSWNNLYDLLRRIFAEINATNAVPSPAEVWDTYSSAIAPLRASPEVRGEFTQLSSSLLLPKAVEAARVLQHLRQRFGPSQEGRPLVGRIRAEAVLRERPRRDQRRVMLTGEEREIAKLAPASFTDFSSFQVEGWGRVLGTISNREGLIIVAPTGGGKTEVFLMPIVYTIAQALQRRRRDVPRFVLLYPRVALLKDQLARILHYVSRAEQQYLSTRPYLPGFADSHEIDEGIVVGFQFHGIRSKALGPQGTLSNPEVFDENRSFQTVDECPICGEGRLRAEDRRSRNVTRLRCTNHQCNATFRTSISKEDHRETHPHLLVTTAESLDRLYLDPRYEQYLPLITGIVFDEVHLYYSLYGVHIYNLIRRIEELRGDQPLVKIAASATVSSPERFAAKLFFGDENRPVAVHSADDYPLEPAGLESLYFLQSPEEENRPGAAPTLIQSVMALGHSVLNGSDRALVFTDSLDMAGRLEAQIRNAETERWNDNGRRRGLWEFRTILDSISFRNQTCPASNPAACHNLYLEGECWRGILGGRACIQAISGLRERALNVVQFSGQQRGRYWEGDVVVATSALEVGLDDERIKTTIHYLPPRTVFSFIQRRGRAGHTAGGMAHTLMILGNTPSDHFYFFRRHRLVYGTYELPLNPQNPIVRSMHDCLRDERQRMRQFIQQDRFQQGIWRWIWETLEHCHLIDRYYGQQLATQRSRLMRDQRGFVRGWIAREKAMLESYLSLRWMLQEIEAESPDELRDIAEGALRAINGFLANQGITAEEVGQRLELLYTELSRIRFRETDPEACSSLQAIQDRVMRVWDALRQQAWGIELRHTEGLYDFFRTLEGLYSQPWVLNSAPDVLKIVLQAMFYLHLGLEDGDEPADCPSRVDYFIPEAYFQETKPVVVEIRYETETDRPPDLHTEDVTDLATLLIPYKPVYRYHPHPFLSMVNTEHNPSWVSPDRCTVTIHLRAEGIRRGGALYPQKVYVRPLRSDDQGQQVVNICPQCYAVYSINRRRRCHDQALRAVKLYADPIVERGYQASQTRSISHTLRFLEGLQGATTVRGSDVRAYTVLRNNNEYTITRNLFRRFQALYHMPIRYSLATKGISWNLTDVVDCVLQDDNLRQQVEQVTIQGNRKSFDVDLVLHTAAHLLHKAVAAISGVNEQVLEYWYDPDRREVAIWERYEGGAGISEIFVEALRTNPVEVYRELLASVLCPVNLAERDDWSSAEALRAELAETWRLSPDDDLITGTMREARAERQMQTQRQEEETRLTCRQNDGCPACLHTTYCTGRNDQPMAVSHLVGEAILRCLVQRMNRDEAERLMTEAIGGNLVPPVILYADPQREVYDVLLL
jgi:ATP-dependent helicase YprA (DUF1998 family)